MNLFNNSQNNKPTVNLFNNNNNTNTNPINRPLLSNSSANDNRNNINSSSQNPPPRSADPPKDNPMALFSFKSQAVQQIK